MQIFIYEYVTGGGLWHETMHEPQHCSIRC
jgi:hypothetical protein